MLWIISHPDRLEPGECDEYDLVASASQQHAEQLSSELGRPVHFLPQATDADTFKIGPQDVDFETSVLYVGNARWPARRAPRWLMRNGRPFHMYGKNWDNYPEGRFVRSDYIPNQELAAAYRSAGVVVADHHGSSNSRLQVICVGKCDLEKHRLFARSQRAAVCLAGKTRQEVLDAIIPISRILRKFREQRQSFNDLRSCGDGRVRDRRLPLR